MSATLLRWGSAGRADRTIVVEIPSAVWWALRRSDGTRQGGAGLPAREGAYSWESEAGTQQIMRLRCRMECIHLRRQPCPRLPQPRRSRHIYCHMSS
jgi:hypothetical protein